MIYTVESGCKYEGGGVDYATTSLIKALIFARNLRRKPIYDFMEHEQLTGYKIKDTYDRHYKAVRKWYWTTKYDFILIREWMDE